MRYFPVGFGVGNKLIYWCHDNHFVPLTDKLPDNILPEIVNIPGGIGDDDDFLWVHLLVKGHVKSVMYRSLWVYGLIGLWVDRFITVSTDYDIRHSV